MHRLRATLPDSRLLPFERACAGTGVDPILLYRWASTVSLAVFDDLATVEVAMRSAMARELAREYGLEWFRRDDLLDDAAIALVDDAWRKAGIGRLLTSRELAHGKLVAALMLGFWVKLLGRGTFRSAGDRRERRIYDTLLWKPALCHAFPGAGALARGEVETAARRSQALRNRIAHHEPIVWGVPLGGESRPDGAVVRLTVAEAHSALVQLAAWIDPALASWLRDYSSVGERLADCPLPRGSQRLLAL